MSALEELFQQMNGVPIKLVRLHQLLSTLGKMIVPPGVSQWNLCVDSNTPYAQGNWIPVVPENYTCLISFRVTNENGFLKVEEI